MPNRTENGLIERIQQRMDALGISARELSLRTTGKPDLVRDIRRKGHAPSAENLARLARELDVSVDWLLGRSFASDPVASEISLVERQIPRGGENLSNGNGIPLVGTGDCADINFFDDQGRVVAIERSSFDPEHTVRMIRRPPALIGARDLYAIYFHGESMQPRFEPGEVGIVDPTRPVAPGDYVLVQLNNGEDDDVVSVLVKRLVHQNSQRVVLEQFNPARQFEVPRDRIARIHRILPQTDLLLGG